MGGQASRKGACARTAMPRRRTQTADAIRTLRTVRHEENRISTAIQFVRIRLIAGSLSGCVIKIGTAQDIPQRQLRAEQHAGYSDWYVLFSIWVNEAGRVERDATARVNRPRHFGTYFKDNIGQTATEVLRCSFSGALQAITDVVAELNATQPGNQSTSTNTSLPERRIRPAKTTRSARVPYLLSVVQKYPHTPTSKMSIKGCFCCLLV
jgi:hypothetical protein